MKQKLYIKNEKGRYEEYREPEPPFDNKLYRRHGKGYVPCSMLLTDDLQEGVWVVTKHYGCKSITSGRYLLENFMCFKASDIQDVSLARLGGMKKLAEHLFQNWDKLPKDETVYNLCHAIVGILFEYKNEE